MAKLTGYQRMQLRIAWLKTDKKEDFDLYVRRVCNLKKIEYTPPIKAERSECFPQK